MNIEYYRSSDLAIVTALSLFYPVESVDRTHSGRIIFLFKKSRDFDELVESYWRGEVRVEPQRFFNQLKTIKTRIYSGE